MKKFLFCFAAGVVLFAFSFGTSYYVSSHKVNLDQCVAGRGCCSHHGGVCGCSYGRTRCCDGTLSPSCQCYRDDVKGIEI